MRFRETGLVGAMLVELEERCDERGFFARAWCADEMVAAGLNPAIAQVNLGHTVAAGTVRGLHLQRDPHAETKFVRCTAGAIFDVIVDLRPGSPTFCRWFGVELTARNRMALYVPEGFAHGYQSLMSDTDVLYQVSVPYAPGSETGFRYDDEAFAIEWPIPPTVVSEKDRGWPRFTATPTPAGASA